MLLPGITRLAGLFDDPAALAAHPPTADMEHLDGGLQFVVGERHHVGVGAVAEHHRLLLQGALERRDVVAQPGRPLEVQLLGGGAHLLFHVTGQPIGLAGQEVAEVQHDLAVFLGADPADARRRALVDIAKQARTVDLVVPLEHSRRAGAGREHPGEQVERLADGPGVRVRPEIPHPLAAGSAIDHQPRELLVQRHREHRVRLVVAVADVEPRIELLDPVVFQLQRLDFGVHHRPLDAARGHHHLARPRRQAGDVGEIGRQPAAQALGLADIDHPTMRIQEPVDTGLDGNRSGRRPVRRWIGHAIQVSTACRPARWTTVEGCGPVLPPN